MASKTVRKAICGLLSAFRFWTVFEATTLKDQSGPPDLKPTKKIEDPSADKVSDHMALIFGFFHQAISGPAAYDLSLIHI